jgi:hypothetical protein
MVSASAALFLVLSTLALLLQPLVCYAIDESCARDFGDQAFYGV